MESVGSKLVSFNDFQPHFFVEKNARSVKLDGDTIYIKENRNKRNTSIQYESISRRWLEEPTRKGTGEGNLDTQP